MRGWAMPAQQRRLSLGEQRRGGRPGSGAHRARRRSRRPSRRSSGPCPCGRRRSTRSASTRNLQRPPPPPPPRAPPPRARGPPFSRPPARQRAALSPLSAELLQWRERSCCCVQSGAAQPSWMKFRGWRWSRNLRAGAGASDPEWGGGGPVGSGRSKTTLAHRCCPSHSASSRRLRRRAPATRLGAATCAENCGAASAAVRAAGVTRAMGAASHRASWRRSGPGRAARPLTESSSGSGSGRLCSAAQIRK